MVKSKLSYKILILFDMKFKSTFLI